MHTIARRAPSQARIPLAPLWMILETPGNGAEVKTAEEHEGRSKNERLVHTHVLRARTSRAVFIKRFVSNSRNSNQISCCHVFQTAGRWSRSRSSFQQLSLDSPSDSAALFKKQQIDFNHFKKHSFYTLCSLCKKKASLYGAINRDRWQQETFGQHYKGTQSGSRQPSHHPDFPCECFSTSEQR